VLTICPLLASLQEQAPPQHTNGSQLQGPPAGLHVVTVVMTFVVLNCVVTYGVGLTLESACEVFEVKGNLRQDMKGW
jgi:hypothetical protein